MVKMIDPSGGPSVWECIATALGTAAGVFLWLASRGL